MRFRTALLPLVMAMFAVSIGAAPAHAAQPTLSINDVTVREPLFGTTQVLFHVSLDKASDETVTVKVTADPGKSGHFYPVARTLTFAPGETSAQVGITVYDNRRYEPTQVYPVVLSGATNAQVGDGTGTLTILNADPQHSIVDCRAATARWRVGSNEGQYGVANAAGSPCKSDRQSGPQFGKTVADPLVLVAVGVGAYSWDSLTGYGAFDVVPRASARARGSRVSTSLYTAAAMPGVDAASVDASVQLDCSPATHTTVATGSSTVDSVEAYVEDQYFTTYLVDEETSENRTFTLPGGTVVETNRTLRTTTQTAGGTLVHHIVQQALVVTYPEGSRVVFGEASASYADGNCAI